MDPQPSGKVLGKSKAIKKTELSCDDEDDVKLQEYDKESNRTQIIFT